MDDLHLALTIYACVVGTCAFVMQALRTYWQWKDRNR